MREREYMREIDLERIAQEEKWSEKHADKLLVVENNVVIIIEETRGREKKDDIDKILNTINKIINEEILEKYVNISKRSVRKFIGIIHFQKRPDIPLIKTIGSINNELRRRRREKIIITLANCYGELRRKIFTLAGSS